jgi:hypothetical protein
VYIKTISLILLIILLVSLQVSAADLWLPVEEYQGIILGDSIILAIETFGRNFECQYFEEVIYISYPDVEFIYNPASSQIVEINIRID